MPSAPGTATEADHGTAAGWPAARRLLRRAEFQRVYASGVRRASPHFVIFALQRGGREARFGITVTRKVGNAVLRNRLRRRAREILRRHGRRAGPGWDVVVHPRVGAATAAWTQLEAELAGLLGKLGSGQPAPGSGGRRAGSS